MECTLDDEGTRVGIGWRALIVDIGVNSLRHFRSLDLCMESVGLGCVEYEIHMDKIAT